MKPQTLSVKRAEVEFHNFASLGEPDRALRVYAEENYRRGSIIRGHAEFIGSMTPFLEIGSSAGHSSYMMCNEFGAGGFALDISADALRHGRFLQDAWKLERAPVRIAGDAAHLPFKDGSLRMVLAFQMLSQFMDIEAVFIEVKRVLAPGGIFFFAEEPIRRLLTLRLYRCPYYDTMKPWERKLHEWGLLGYLVRDVIGAHQEESFGIRQNHRMYLADWHRLIVKHFAGHEYEIFAPERGWGERVMKRMAVKLDKYGTEWRAAKLLGGTLAAFCRKAGPVEASDAMGPFETYLRCPDCKSDLTRNAEDEVRCAKCGYTAPNEGGVYNLLPSAEKKELYPGDRQDVIDFSLPGHESKLRDGWYELEGVFGNKYRWISDRAVALLESVSPGPQRVRIRGHANDRWFEEASAPRVEVRVNGATVGEWKLDRSGLFILEADVPDASHYEVEVLAGPLWQSPPDNRRFSVSLSMIRLIPRDS